MGRPARDRTGETIGWLYVQDRLESGDYLCICTKGDCGKTRVVTRLALMRNQMKQCAECAYQSRAAVKMEGESTHKMGPRMAVGGLTTWKLTVEQRLVYRAMMGKRKWTTENRDEALNMIHLATSRGTLSEELAFWTEPCGSETHASTSLAHAINYGVREGAGA